jgi:hypothetical protein
MKEVSGEVTKRSVVAVIRITHIPAGDIAVYGSVPGTHTILANDHGFLHDQPVAVDLLRTHVRMTGKGYSQSGFDGILGRLIDNRHAANLLTIPFGKNHKQ